MMLRRALFSLGLIVLGGCSAGGDPATAPSPATQARGHAGQGGRSWGTGGIASGSGGGQGGAAGVTGTGGAQLGTGGSLASGGAVVGGRGGAASGGNAAAGQGGSSRGDAGVLDGRDAVGTDTGRTGTGGTPVRDDAGGQGGAIAGRDALSGTGGSAIDVTSSGRASMGMNIGPTNDYSTERPYADIMKTARSFTGPSGSGSVATDGNGWPQADFSCYLWAGIAKMNGTYALSFKGQATSVKIGGDASLGALSYDSASNTTSGTFVVSATGQVYATLTMTGTKRTQASAAGSGVTDIKIMRPTSPGANTTLPASTATQNLWNPQFTALLRKVSTVRYMSYLGTNSNQQASWSDRALPGAASLNRQPSGYGWEGLGGPWEHIILLSNETGTDPWIDIPVSANDDYVTKVAQVFKCGSNGTTPWVDSDGVTCMPGAPSYPPLNPSLHLYVEYSNELWNTAGAFGQSATNNALAKAEVAAYPSGKGPLNFDGETNSWYWAWRRVANRLVQISTIFRSVFGDAAMMTHVRPVLETQQGNGQETLRQASTLLLGYYANLWGQGVSTPHSPSYYVYGGGGSGYYNPDNSSSSLTLDNIWTSQTMSVTAWAPVLNTDVDYTAMLGIARTAYEAGPSFDSCGTSGIDAVKSQAAGDTRMTTALVQHHAAWRNAGGVLIMYFVLAGDYQWGFTSDVVSPSSPKLTGLDQIGSTALAPATHGTAIPGTVPGGSFAVNNVGSSKTGTGGVAYAQNGDGWNVNRWGSYTFLATDTAARNVVVNLASASGNVTVLVDGSACGTKTAANGAITFSAGTLSPGVHGVLVLAASGSFTLSSVSVQ